LVQLQEDAATLDSLGYQIIAIGTDLPEKIAETEKKWGIGFPLLSDPDLRAAHA
jgi:peroxiredoxin